MNESTWIMGRCLRAPLLLATLLLATGWAAPDTPGRTPGEGGNPGPHAKLRGVEADAVKWTSGFWAQKFDLCRREMLPSVQAALLDSRNSEQLVNLKIAAGLESGEYRGHHWSDGDCYKWIEAMALMYSVTGDASLDRKMDEWIDVIARAQMPDGYISTNMQLKKLPFFTRAPKGYGGTYHEMYNFGHLLTAACVHHRCTGKDSFLRVARKAADLLHATLTPGSPALAVTSGNMPVIMGLVDLCRITGDRRYRETAKVIVDARGTIPGEGDQTQDHVPFREETEAVGHAVFATYLYAGAADLYAETGERALWDALERIWQSAALRRTYITGGACAIPNGKSARGDAVHEAFGADYQLPNRTAYNETCANIGNAMWNWRMLQISGDAKYADMMERVLYNSGLSPVSADGKNFFYANPLEWNGESGWPTKHFTEQRWFVHACYCCPPQIARTIAGLGRWAYSVSPNAVWVHLYGGNTLQTRLPDGAGFALKQETQYPWDGRIKITVQKAPDAECGLKLRVPGWADGAALKVNGRPWSDAVRPGTYVSVDRKWSAGDEVELNFEMRVRLMDANPAVEDCRNRVAVMRGPVVYCLEIPKDKGAVDVWKAGVFIPGNAQFVARHDKDFLGGVTVLEGKALTAEGRDRLIGQNAAAPAKPSGDWSHALYRELGPRPLSLPTENTIDLTLIPYFAWANRGPALMEVWIPLAR